MPQKWPGVGPRIIQRLKELGYRSERTKTGADLLRFSLDRTYPITYLQKWATDGATPDRENLLRLADDLGVSLQWLLIGNGERPTQRGGKRPRRMPVISGASDADWRHYVNQMIYGWWCICTSRRLAFA